jgi:hypothetical protein
METATLTRSGKAREPGRNAVAARLRGLPWPLLALAALSIATFIGFLVYPTYPNYDSYYSLLWGREALHGTLPSFDAYRAPTEHPLAIAFGALLSLLGDTGDRVMVFATLASFVVLAAGLYRLARASFGSLVGLAAAGLVCTRFDFPFLAARAYVDIPYLAFVIWAAALEADQRRRGTPVLLLLAAAGLMRPEAWLLAGLYFLWIAVPATWLQRLRYALLAAIGPVTWAIVDLVVTGDPKFSLTHTSGLAEELGRTRGLAQVPSATYDFLVSLDKLPVLAAGVLGIVLAIVLVPRRVGMPLVLLVIGVGTFFLVGLAGLSVIDRYLLVPSLMVMVFAAVTLAGWSMLREGSRVRRAWAVGAVLLIAYGVVFTLSHVNFRVFDNELRFRGDSHRSLRYLLAQPAVQRARRCGPVSTPNHKLIPDVRWILKAGVGDVLARSDASQRARIGRGVAIVPVDRQSLLRQGCTAGTETPEDTADAVPPPGFQRLATAQYYSAYVRC